MRKPVTSIENLELIRDEYNRNISEFQYRILVCAGAGCISSGCESVKNGIIEEIKALSLENKVKVYETGCIGTCSVGPVMLILPERIFYTNLTPETARYIVKSHIIDKTIPTEHTFLIMHFKSIFR